MADIPQLPLDAEVAVATLPTPAWDSESPTAAAQRKMSAPPTPPITPEDPEGAAQLERAVHVLATEATALSFAARLYQSDPRAKAGLLRAVDAVVAANEKGGKLVVCGVGKSGIVGQKIVATMKSFGLATSFLHAAEAMHGDLGDIRPNDAVLFITYSGRTAELLAAAAHLDPSTPVIILTSHLDRSAFPLCADRLADDPSVVLLPAPIHETEEVSFGVCAPTTSTTVAMAVGDMLALAAARRCHDGRVGHVFARNHPGGAIGAAKGVKKRRLS